MANNSSDPSAFFFATILLTGLFLSVPNDVDAQSVDESTFVTLGGIEQWISISGEDRSNPVILFLHGGPGSVLSPYADVIYSSWKKEFTLVNWDQRGAGKTFGRNAPAEVGEDYWADNPLTIDQMASDGIELTRYLLKFLKKDKVILIGTSWGSILATEIVLRHPELFHAYIGHAQFVSFKENMRTAYHQTLDLAMAENDRPALEMLKGIGEPPYDKAQETGQLLRLVKNYESKHSVPAPDEWWKPGPEYDSEEDAKDRYNGDDYSFLYFSGHKGLGIESMAIDVDFQTKRGHEFGVPVYFVQGKYDILTSEKVSRPYYERIVAPDKGYFVVPDAGHGFNRSVVDQLYQVLQEKVCQEPRCGN